MKLLDDIITSVTDTKEPISDILRRCLVLAFKLKNEPLKKWVEKELNGYEYFDEDLPDYRRGAGVARGLFLGGFGMQLNDQPIPAHVLKDEHRHFANQVRLNQPIASYERDGQEDGQLPWPADLVVAYQKEFFQGMALNRAWMEIPSSMVKGLIDTVRTRVLTFALEIRDELPSDDEDAVKDIMPAVVQRIFNVTIQGGNNVVGDVQEFNAPTVIAGDMHSLKAALSAIGVTEGEFTELEASLKEDGTYAITDGKPTTPGKKTTEWIGTTAKNLGKAGLKAGGEIAVEVVRRAILGYLGMGG